MPGCCYPEEYGEQFTEREAGRTSRRFARRGLQGSALELAQAVLATGVENATVLEVGGGVGHIQAHLLRAGAGYATNIEMSPSWEGSARRLLEDLDLTDRVVRRLGDLVDEAEELPRADVVVLHRVVCCYPDWQALTAAAISRARRVVALTIPVDRWWNRAIVRAGNRFLAVRHRAFRAFVHPPDAIVAAVEDAGFQVTTDRSHLVWRTVVLART